MLCPWVVIASLAAGAVDGQDAAVVEAEIRAIRSELATYRERKANESIDRQRRIELEAIVTSMLEDSASRVSFTSHAWNTIGSADGDFTLTMNFYEQFDWALNHNPVDGTQKGFAVFNARITFSGTVIDPSWQYFIRLQMGADGTGDDEFAYLQKSFDGGWSLQAGLITPMFSLEQAVDSIDLLGTSLSYVAGQFDPENTEGAALAWQGDDFRWWGTICNGWSSGNANWVGNQRTGIIARAEWKPFGNWNDLYLFNPFPEEVVEGLLCGVGGSHSWGTNLVATPPIEGASTQLTADVSWQRPGLGLMACGYWQDSEPGGILAGRRVAAVAQASLMPTPEWALYLRGEWGSQIDGNQPDLAGATLGTSWFPVGDASIKWSIEILGMFGDTVGWRTDGDPAIVQVDADQFAIRTQIQISL